VTADEKELRAIVEELAKAMATPHRISGDINIAHLIERARRAIAPPDPVEELVQAAIAWRDVPTDRDAHQAMALASAVDAVRKARGL
jgi:hypothetical protein